MQMISHNFKVIKRYDCRFGIDYLTRVSTRDMDFEQELHRNTSMWKEN